MGKKYTLDKQAFRRQRLPYALLMMLPSFAVDVKLFASIFTNDSAYYNNFGEYGLWGIPLVFLFNAALLKSPGLFFYFQLKWQRKRSYVQVDKKGVLYRKRKLVGRSLEYGYAYFVEYRIGKIESLERRNNGSIYIAGNINAVYYHQDGTTEHHRRNVGSFVIPAYFEKMDEIYAAIQKGQA